MISAVHELHCGSFCPVHSTLYFPAPSMTCRCLLLETSAGLVLCDTGLPHWQEISSLAQNKLKLMQTHIQPSELCTEKIKNLGFQLDDVKHIILTHLDIDHAGSIVHFPKATIHLHRTEAQYFNHIPFRYRFRYFQEILPKSANLQMYEAFGESWNGFQSAYPLKELKEEVSLIPLLGHSAGHSGIAIYFKGKWVIHCGDAFYFIEDLNKELHSRNLASESLQTLSAFNNEMRIRTINQLQLLKQNHSEIRITNSHDPRLSFF